MQKHSDATMLPLCPLKPLLDTCLEEGYIHVRPRKLSILTLLNTETNFKHKS